MTHALTIALGDDADLRWAQHTVTAAHYLHAVDQRMRVDVDALPAWQREGMD